MDPGNRSSRRPALLLPTLTDVTGVFLLVLVTVTGTQRLFGDSDTATHVATGYWVLEHREIPQVDPFSASFGGERWFAYEWLADVLFALVHAAAGWAGLVALSAVLITAAHVLLYRFLVRRGCDSLAAFGAVVAAAGAASSHWLARPHLLSVLCLVLWIILLERVANRRCGRGWLWLLPPLAMVWANLHGAYLVAFPIGACYVLGEIWRRRRGQRPAALTPLLAALTGAALATLVNPYGWHLPVHLIGFAAVPPAILDFEPASLTDRAGLALAGFLILCLVLLLAAAWVSRRRPAVGIPSGPSGDTAAASSLQPGTVLAFLLTGAMALVSIRHVEVAAILGAVVLADSITVLLRRALDTETATALAVWRRYEIGRGGAVLLAAVLVLGTLAARGTPAAAGYDPRLFPVDMVRSLRLSGVEPQGPVFSSGLWGGYLILEWPQAGVFVDGRVDMYGDEFMARWSTIYAARPGWDDALEWSGVRWTVLPRDAPLVTLLETTPGWVRWSADATTVVHHRQGAEPPPRPAAP